jgi:hypothetical protein
MNGTAAGMVRRDFLRGVSVAAGLLAAPEHALAATTTGSVYDRRKWWQHEYRVLQTNLREIDALEDPREIARATRAFGANVLVSNIGGIVAFYPSQLTLHYRNPFLKSDFSGEMVAAAHAEGLAYIGRFDLSKALKPAYDAHPDWFMRNRDGSPREYAGTYQACPNGGWAQDYSLQILKEGVERHEVDGLFFNMTGFVRTDYADVDHGICACDNCARRFRELYKLDLPAKDDDRDPNWPAYMQFQQQVMAELSAKATAVIRAARPDAPLMDFFGGVVARGEVQRRVSRKAPEWPYAMGEQTRWARSALGDKTFSATSTAHIDYPWRQVTESSANHLLRFAQALGTGTKLDLYLMGTLADQDDPRYLEPVSRLFHWHAANERHYAGLQPAARVAIYNVGSPFQSAPTGLARYSPNAARGLYQALADARIPFWMTNANQLRGAKNARLYDVVILPHVTALADEDAAVLDAFVESGGLLIATGYTGGLRKDGKPRASQPMRSSPVASFGMPVDGHGWSLDMIRASLPLGPGRIPIDAEFFPVKARNGAVSLIPFAPDQRFGPPEFSYAEPGKPARSDPGALLMAYRRGHSVHIPWMPDWLYYRDGIDAHRDLISALVARYAPPPQLVLEGPGAVEMMAMRQPQTGKLLVHVINYSGQRNTRYADPVPIHGLQLGVRGPVGGTAQMLVAGKAIRGRRRSGDADHLWFDLPPVKAFEAVQIGLA